MKKNFLIAITIVLMLAACSAKKPALEAYSAEPELLPIFIIPSVDIEHGNELQSVCIEPNQINDTTLSIEYTLIFKDEDHPSAFLDMLYDIYRSFKYKRIADTETFFIQFQKNDSGIWQPVLINFANVYSDHQTFYKSDVKHFSLEVPASPFTYTDNRIVIYVNTWNHMFAHFDTNPELHKVTLEKYPLYRATRQMVEFALTH